MYVTLQPLSVGGELVRGIENLFLKKKNAANKGARDKDHIIT